MALDAEKELDVYLDMKSPHAYLAVRPSLAVARDYRVRVHFLLYTTSYAASGLTTRVEADKKRRPGTPTADRKASKYYTAAREYPVRQGVPFRTPCRLLDSDSANKVFFFAKQQGRAVRFLIRVYVQGWGSRWRAYALESLKQLCGTLAEVGARTDGFEEFMAPNGTGEAEIVSCMAKVEAAGFTCVPHYVLNDAPSGREHLAPVREKFGAQGLARTDAPRPEFTHARLGAPAKR